MNKRPQSLCRVSTVNVERSTVNVERSTLNVETSTVNVETSTVNVETSTVNVERSTVDVDTSTLNVEASTLDVDTSTLNVEASTLDVEASTVDVERSTVDVERSTVDVDTSTVNVEVVHSRCGEVHIGAAMFESHGCALEFHAGQPVGEPASTCLWRHLPAWPASLACVPFVSAQVGLCQAGHAGAAAALSTAAAARKVRGKRATSHTWGSHRTSPGVCLRENDKIILVVDTPSLEWLCVATQLRHIMGILSR